MNVGSLLMCMPFKIGIMGVVVTGNTHAFPGYRIP